MTELIDLTGPLLRYICNPSATSLSSYEGKSVEVLWTEFKEALNSGIQKFIPSKFSGNEKHLPWITQSIKREIRKRDRLYKKFIKSKDSKDRKAFLNSKHGVKKKINTAYDKYLRSILPMISTF